MQLEQSLALAESHLASHHKQDFSTVKFEWKGIHFVSKYAHLDDGSYQIQITGDLGRLPFTIENPKNRQLALDAITLANRTHDGAYTIKRDATIEYRCLTQTDMRLFGRRYIEALTAIMLHNGRHLLLVKDLLKEVPISAGVAAA